MHAFIEVTLLELYGEKVSDEFSTTFLINVSTIRAVLRHGEFTSLKLDDDKIITIDFPYDDFVSILDYICMTGGVGRTKDYVKTK